VVFFLTAALVAIADQLTKTWVRSYDEGYTIFRTGLFQIIHIRNTGAAFGMFQSYSLILTVVTLFVMFAILATVLFFWRRVNIFGNLLARTAVGLYFGGAIGNLIDRLRYGYVTDFMDFRIWPVFNVADAAMTVGVVLFIYSILFLSKAEKV
jgi:signal peptidase II